MKYKHVTVASLLVASVFVSGCSQKANQYVLFDDKNSVTAPEIASQQLANTGAVLSDSYEHKLVPNNRLSILVYNHPELSTRDVRAQVAPSEERGALIANDGTINIPLVGVVRVSGLSERETANLLSREYSRYIKNAHVTVEVLNKRVFVIGEVKTPGRVNIIENSTNILEAIAGTGGLTDFAARNRIRVIRGTTENPIVKTIDLTNPNSLNLASLSLQPNDVVYVEPTELRQRNMAIAEQLPGINFVQSILSALFTGKQLTNTRVFNVNTFTGYQQ